MRIAVVGARGIANYGGFETLVSELAPRLKEKGHEVLVSHRLPESGERASSYEGVEIMYFPFRFPRDNRLGRLFEVLYDWFFVLKSSMLKRCDAVYCLGVASALILPACRMTNTRFLVNVDGVEWRRAKFSTLERAFIRLSFIVSCVFSNLVILDNGQLVDYVPRKFHHKTAVVPYGVSIPSRGNWSPPSVRASYGSASSPLSFGSYWLVVARLEPENSIHLVIEAYLKSVSNRPLVIVGDFSSREYERLVESMVSSVPHGKSVVFTGSMYDRDRLAAIRQGCWAYIHGHTVGGTNPSLLEAMASANLIIAHDNPFNEEVSETAARYFADSVTLTKLIDELDADSGVRGDLGQKAAVRVAEFYKWENITDSFNSLLIRLGPTK